MKEESRREHTQRVKGCATKSRRNKAWRRELVIGIHIIVNYNQPSKKGHLRLINKGNEEERREYKREGREGAAQGAHLSWMCLSPAPL